MDWRCRYDYGVSRPGSRVVCPGEQFVQRFSEKLQSQLGTISRARLVLVVEFAARGLECVVGVRIGS